MTWAVSQTQAFHLGAVRGTPFEVTEASFSFLIMYCLSSMETESVGNLGWILCTQSVVGGGGTSVWMARHAVSSSLTWYATQLKPAAAWKVLSSSPI